MTAEAVDAAYDELAAALEQFPLRERSNGLHASRYTAPVGTPGRAHAAPWAAVWTNPTSIGWAVWPGVQDAPSVGKGIVATYAEAIKAADERLNWWLAQVAERPEITERLARWFR